MNLQLGHLVVLRQVSPVCRSSQKTIWHYLRSKASLSLSKSGLLCYSCIDNKQNMTDLEAFPTSVRDYMTPEITNSSWELQKPALITTFTCGCGTQKGNAASTTPVDELIQRTGNGRFSPVSSHVSVGIKEHRFNGLQQMASACFITFLKQSTSSSTAQVYLLQPWLPCSPSSCGFSCCTALV